jgi:hypothetical protein
MPEASSLETLALIARDANADAQADGREAGRPWSTCKAFRAVIDFLQIWG